MIRQPWSRHTLNESFFSEIDSETAAYWLGFIVADGHLWRDRSLKIGLAQRDKDHLEKLRQDIGSTAPVKCHRNSDGSRVASIQLCSTRLVADLRSHGLIGKTPDYRPIVPGHMFAHYARGLIDGDGWISPHLHGGMIVGLCGWRHVLDQYAAWVRLQTGSQAVPQPHGRIWQLCLCGNHARTVLRLMYRGASVQLDRNAPLAAIGMAAPQAVSSGRRALTAELATQIRLRTRAGESRASIAAEYNVSYSLVRQIHLGQKWREEAVPCA